MATCKDCISFSRCKEMYEAFGVSIDLENSVVCKHFKNKADFVEVVRCKECNLCELRYPAKAIGEEAIEGYYCHLNQRYVKSTDFCNYGERRRVMAEHIKRIDVMKICGGYSRHCFLSNDSNGQGIADRILDDVVEIPTADVVEVKHGEWRLHPDGSGTCSCCNRTQKSVWDYDSIQNFCGHCGADMRGVLQ